MLNMIMLQMEIPMISWSGVVATIAIGIIGYLYKKGDENNAKELESLKDQIKDDNRERDRKFELLENKVDILNKEIFNKISDIQIRIAEFKRDTNVK